MEPARAKFVTTEPSRRNNRSGWRNQFADTAPRSRNAFVRERQQRISGDVSCRPRKASQSIFCCAPPLSSAWPPPPPPSWRYPISP